MSSPNLHEEAIVIDGLVISNWSRAVFEDMHRGGLTAANCTCCVWEGFRGTMNNVAQWKRWFDEYGDILLQVHTSDDIRRAKAEGKVGIILGWQNTSGIEDQLGYLHTFKDLGVGVMQLTYNTQNLVGSGCFESRDGGLSDFGREVIDEMNRLGILVDLSHVGSKTSEDAIRHSKKPVAYTHCCPAALRDHPRNKTDEQLRFIVDHGGFVGFATFPPFLPNDAETTLDDCVDAIDHVVDLIGEDNVGIGTDFTQNQSADWFDWLRKDKGYGRWLMEGKGTTAPMPEKFRTLAEYPNLTAAFDRRGWSEGRIRKVLGENWLRVLKDVWGA
jgi:membrane dipeptidase